MPGHILRGVYNGGLTIKVYMRHNSQTTALACQGSVMIILIIIFKIIINNALKNNFE